MLPETIAEKILEGHLKGTLSISDIPGFRLDLQLDYSGLMAKGAYENWKKFKHQDRKKVGAFDFKIYRIGPTNIETPLVHPICIKEAGQKLNRDMINHVFMGKDPEEIECTPEKLIILQEIQLAMLEQEINWGDENFQTWTNFPPSKKMRSRDFITAYLRRIFEEPTLLENIKMVDAASGTSNVLPPPKSQDWEKFLKPPELGAKPWINDKLLYRFKEAAESLPDNPKYHKKYKL